MNGLRYLAAAASITLVACAAETVEEPGDPDLGVLDTAGARPLTIPDPVWNELQSGQAATVIVHVDPEALARFEGSLPFGVNLVRTYEHLPFRVLDLPHARAALQLLGHTDVLSIEEDVIHQLSLSDGLAAIRQPAAASHGYLGEGTSVVVVDTGVDWTHPDLGSCTGAGTPASCRVVYNADLAPDDGQLDDHVRHGTNVAAIVAGVAPGTDIIGLDVFVGSGGSSSDLLEAFDWSIANKDTYNIAAMNLSLGHGGYTSTCAGSIFDSAIQSARDAGISVVVASGNDGFTNGMSSPACAPGSLSVGAVHDASNSGTHCMGGAIEADDVACFSNSASFLDILAPGVDITAGGVTMSGTSMATPYVAGAMAVLRGAYPDASVASLESQLIDAGAPVTDPRNGLTFPRLDLMAALDVERCDVSASPGTLSPDPSGDSGSISVTSDSGCAWSVASSAPWLTVSGGSGTGNGSVSWTAAPNVGASRTATLDFGGAVVTATQAAASGSAGGILINGGAASTNDNSVTITMNAPGAAYYCLSNTDQMCRRFFPYRLSANWRLQGGSGERVVTAWFLDGAGNIGEPVSDSILLDRGRPDDGELVASGHASGVSLSWSGFSDADTEVKSYRLVEATGRRGPRTGCTDTPIYTGTETSFEVTELVPGAKHHWRVCAIDDAGNVSKGATATLEVRSEYDGPAGTVVLDGGAAFTGTRVVVASLQATDASRVTDMCVSTTDSCRRWSPMSDQVSVALSNTPGTHTVHAWFRDEHGNFSGPFTDDIVLDPVGPTDGTVVPTPGSGSVSLQLSGFTDEGSGIAAYTVYQVDGARPPRRCEGTPVYAGPDTTIVIPDLVNGRRYAFRVCAVDRVGNTSRGVELSGTPAPERNPPTGTALLAGGAEGTNQRRVELQLDASDDSGLARMCVSLTDTCRRWTNFDETTSVTLGRGGWDSHGARVARGRVGQPDPRAAGRLHRLRRGAAGGRDGPALERPPELVRVHGRGVGDRPLHGPGERGQCT